jgi:hypothetical protein
LPLHAFPYQSAVACCFCCCCQQAFRFPCVNSAELGCNSDTKRPYSRACAPARCLLGAPPAAGTRQTRPPTISAAATTSPSAAAVLALTCMVRQFTVC